MSFRSTPDDPGAAAAAEADDALADALFEAEARAAAESPPRRPSATYRLQLYKGFQFDHAAAVVDYLADLGVSDCYFSPYLDARPGSTHGYDVFDHSRINPEIGDEAAHRRLLAALTDRGMGQVLDVVPNHMGIKGPNRYWLEVMEAGPHAPSSRFFDIDWHPVKEELDGRVLLAILEDQYGKVLEDGKLVLERDGGSFFVRYHETRLPLAPKSYARVLERRTEDLLARYGPDDPHVQEYRSIWASARNLPPFAGGRPEQVEETLREKEVIKRRIERLCAESEVIREFLDANVASFRGQPGDPRSFDAMDRLLEEQVYRLAFWRVAADEINYRRFFDINDLAGVRVEEPDVFEFIHSLIFRWVDEGGVTGLRVDHPDGLADPLGYFRRLQESLFLRACRRRLIAEDAVGDWLAIADRLRRRHREAVADDPTGPLARRFPIVAEKILSRGEALPDDWPIDGTVGYEYLNMLNGLFIDPEAAGAIAATYAEFTGDRRPFADVLYDAKMLITRVSLASEVQVLARQLDRLCERDRRHRDFTLGELRAALREAIACFPVYRTYLKPGQEVPRRDRPFIDRAVAAARRRNPSLDATVFDFLHGALLMEQPAIESIAPARDAFVVRFQQTTGPVQAKGLEDTAFYRQATLASINEVGGDPWRFGVRPETFHEENARRLQDWPGSLGTTATHDTKRGEDVRARINAISELPDDWRDHLARWSRRNASKKVEAHGAPAPSPAEEYLFYQVLLGIWPFGATAALAPEGIVARLQEYMIKAVREAKVNTTWTDADPSYVEAVASFVAATLEDAAFLADVVPFQARLARIGVVNSLAQTLLKLASPGVPDVYQGCELWDLCLVDPDNRRPVDFDRRRALFEEIRGGIEREGRESLARRLLANPDDGAIKLYLTATVLNHRRTHADLFGTGSYRPVEAQGKRAAHVVAFLREHKGNAALAVAPRLVGRLMGDDAANPPLSAVWADTRLTLPPNAPAGWRDALTDRRHDADRGHLSLPEILDALPVALLVAEPSP
ncbi:MAG TPA: malto-oligosyltrehalose synthase [Isosphaeraceae bacterium]|jgi:(1->4)-alpha-D-glucan 1-alpha-D-glucosylmutase|nr:malto-oligosyltrehalose synthase [Isosphaeraceae bacterium]